MNYATDYGYSIDGQMPTNEDLPAGSPMVFACRQCGTPIWVPECYVAKPELCPDCGGEWSEGRLELTL